MEFSEIIPGSIDVDELSFVKKIAASLYAKRFDDSISFDDYKQYAFVGYLEAKKRFDPAKGSFKTFAFYRIKGAVLNGISKDSEKLNAYFFKKKNKRISVTFLDGDNSENLFEDFAQSVIEAVTDNMLDSFFEELSIYEGSLEDDIYASDLSKKLLVYIEELPEIQKNIIIYHYFSELSFTAIATMLSLSRGRISQLHSAAIKALSKRLGREDLLVYL